MDVAELAKRPEKACFTNDGKPIGMHVLLTADERDQVVAVLRQVRFVAKNYEISPATLVGIMYSNRITDSEAP